MYKVTSLVDDLRRLKVVGVSADPFTFSIMWSSSDALLIRYDSNKFTYTVWVHVRRTGKQYYRVIACVTKFDHDYTVSASFRNSQLTADYIKKFII